jgi:hypothetical protein
MTTLTIGDRNPDGTLEITDTAWDHNGTLRVTVRELFGERSIPANRLRAMRRLARRAIPHPDQTTSSRVLRTWYAQGGSHATFAVSRLPR